MDEAAHDAQTNDAYRAVGRYFVEFSRLIREMRRVMVWRVARGGDTQEHLAELLLGEAMPSGIANAFFGMCRLVGALDEDEKRVESRLRDDVKAAIQTRNDFAHGDWFVGAPPSLVPHLDAIHDPLLRRTIPNRTEGPTKELILSVNEMDERTDDLEALARLVMEFGSLALGLAIVRVDAGGTPRSSFGELRVRDILELHGGGKKGPAARVLRTGPMAASVYQTRY